MAKYFLRELERSDAAVINKWRNDRKIIGSLGSPYRYISDAVDDAWVDNYLANRSNCVRLMICDAGTKKAIGAVYLLNIDWISRSCEFSIWIGDRDAQGKGAGYFASSKALQHAFNDLNLNSVYLTVLSENQRAMNLYKKIGFQVEGTRRQAVFKNGCYSDLCMMSILSSEFVRPSCT